MYNKLYSNFLLILLSLCITWTLSLAFASDLPAKTDHQQQHTLETHGDITHDITLKPFYQRLSVPRYRLSGEDRLRLKPASAAVNCSSSTVIDYTTPHSTITAVISAPNEIDCYTFSTAANDIVRVAIVEKSGTLVATQQIWDSNGTVVCALTTATSQDCKLTTEGTYTLAVKDTTTKTGDYLMVIFQLNSPPGCAALSYGDPASSQSLDANEIYDCFTFTANAGDQVRVTLLENGILYGNTEVFAADGTLVCGAKYSSSAFSLDCKIVAGGSYTLLVRDNSYMPTGVYRLHLQNLNNWPACTALNYGNPTSSQSLDDETYDCFTFTAAAGDWVRVTLIWNSSLYLYSEVRAADGTTVCGGNSQASFTTDCTPLAGGSYMLLVHDAFNTAGAYQVNLQKVNSPSNCAVLNYGGPVSSQTLDSDEAFDCFTFTATAGDDVRLTLLQDGSLYFYLEVRAADGGIVCTKEGSTNFAVDCTLLWAGDYTVLIHTAHYATGPYRLHLQQLNSPSGCTALSYGGPFLEQSFDADEVYDCFTFTATAGDWVRITATQNNTFDRAFEILTADGTSLCSYAAPNYMNCQLALGGTLTLLVRVNYYNATGPYRLHLQKLNNLSGCTDLNYGGAAPTYTLVGDEVYNCFTFNAAAGDRVRVTLIEHDSLYLKADVYTADGTYVCSTVSPDYVDCKLTAGGNYTLLIWEFYYNGFGPYQLHLQQLNDLSGCTALSYGGSASVQSLEANGLYDCFTFTSAAADDRIRISLLAAGDLSLKADVSTADGTILCKKISSGQNCALTAQGSYTIFVWDDDYTDTGTYRIHLQKLNTPTGCPALNYGNPPLLQSLDADEVYDCFTFTAAAGDRVRITLIENGSSFSGYLQVLKAGGTSACSDRSSNASFYQNCTLTAGGVYTLLVRDYNYTAAAAYKIHLQKLNSPPGCPALSYGNPPSSQSLDANEVYDCFTFTANAGDPVRVTMIGNDHLYGYTEVFDTVGTSVCTPTYSDCILMAGGTYTLLVSDYTATGPYRLHLLKLNSLTGCQTLNYGNPVSSQSLDEDEIYDCFTFTAEPGDRVRVTLIANDTFYVYADVLAADGTNVCNDIYYTYDCFLADGGVYILLVSDYNHTATGPYQLHLLKLNSLDKCTPISPNGSAVTGTIQAPAQIDCFSFVGTENTWAQISLHPLNSLLSNEIEIFIPYTGSLCTGQTGSFVCLLPVEGQYTALVWASDYVSTGGYSLKINVSTVISPADAVPERNMVLTTTPTLHWSSVTWAAEYVIQISANPTFAAPGYYHTAIVTAETLEYTLPTEHALPGDGVYYWRVRAQRPGYTGRWSGIERFQVGMR